MIADLNPYAAYVESNRPWLGQVPAHWEVVQARHIGRFLKGVGGTKEDSLPSGIPCVRYGELYTTHSYFIRKSKAYVSEERAESYTAIVFGDVLFAASGEKMEEIGKSAVNLLQTRAVCGGDVVILRPAISVHSPFLGYALDCYPAASQKATMGRGTTIKHIYPGELKCLVFPLPPFDEQVAIARFLDRASEKLDRAIRAKRRVIALLNEQKQVIINHAVTRGLDAAASWKPSGIPGFGDIPNHWLVQRTKTVFRLRTEKSGLAHGKELLSIYTHIGVRPRKEMQQKGNKASTTDNYWIVRKGDLIVNKLLAWMGAVGVSAYEGVTSPAYDILQAVRPVYPDYYHSLFRTKLYLSLFKQRSYGIMDMRLRLYFYQLGQIPIPIPPLDEQIAIVDFFQKETSGITSAISRLEKEVDLLREFRTRLIADVVTGKLDVREAAAKLPDEPVSDMPEEDDSLEVDEELTDEEAVA